MRSTINFASDVPKPEGGFDVFRPKASEILKGVILSDALQGVWTHWIDDRAEVCVHPAEVCRGCRGVGNRRWKGYLYATALTRRGIGLLELSDMAAFDHTRRLAGKGAPIFGCAYSLWRKGGAPRGRLFLEIAALPMPNARRPQVPDLRLAIRAHYEAQAHRVGDVIRPEGDEGDDMIPFPGVG